MKEHFLEELGIYYRSTDIRPDRTTLVFIHSLLSSSAIWLRYFPAFEGTYNILASDLRGHGHSRKPGRYEDYSVENMAQDITALLEHLKVKTYIPVSSSLSSLVALELLQKRLGAPAAVFLNPVYGTHDILLTRVSRDLVALATRIARLFRYSNEPASHTDYPRLGPVRDWSPKLLGREVWNTTLHVYLFCLDNFYKRNYDPWWDELRIPALIIHGERDIISPIAQVRRLAGKLPHAKLVVLPEGSHVLMLNYHGEVTDIIRDYLESLSE